MSIITDAESKVSNFLWAVAIKKGLVKLVATIAVVLAADPLAKKAGLNVSVDQTAMVGFLVGIAEVFRNYLKQHVKSLNWL